MPVSSLGLQFIIIIAVFFTIVWCSVIGCTDICMLHYPIYCAGCVAAQMPLFWALQSMRAHRFVH